MKSIWQKDYAMVFWADEEREPVETVLKIDDFLRPYGEDYVLKYLNDRVEVAMDRQALAERCDPNRRKDELLTQSYFSGNRIWFALSTGRTEYNRRMAPQMMPATEVLTLEFDSTHLQGADPALDFIRLQEIFWYCLHLFAPYYGRLQMTGEVNYEASPYREISYTIDLTKVPAAIEWFNYFNPEWVDRLGGLEDFLTAPVLLAEPVEGLGGVVLILQEEPFDYRNPRHLQNRALVEAHLDLPRLHQLFRES